LGRFWVRSIKNFAHHGARYIKVEPQICIISLHRRRTIFNRRNMKRGWNAKKWQNNRLILFVNKEPIFANVALLRKERLRFVTVVCLFALFFHIFAFIFNKTVARFLVELVVQSILVRFSIKKEIL